ncbi:C-type lectin mosGCTL-1-like [Saccoglossus kowalevskii]|uniref:Perlucin-like protein-like n=1 Tax=Saccoglossus kowalevskii TaxID=10224 RepID=A0ABM0N0R7_SACKO|nr:PREDICTED: perlucin-like protein-like [Saccoglossus kowalevskii]
MKSTVFILVALLSIAYGQNYTEYISGCNHLRGTTVEYQIFTDEVFWAEAESYCHDYLGGNLARIHNDETNTLILSYIESSGAGDAIATGFWIGLNDIRNEGVYVWSNGGETCYGLDYIPWGNGEPNNNTKKDSNGQDCVQLRKSMNWSWDDDYCSYRPKGFICEIPVCSDHHECNVCQDSV